MTIASIVAMGLAGCSSSSAKVAEKVDAQALKSPSVAAESAAKSQAGQCNPGLFKGFPDPQVAYAAYAEAINGSRWCEAINTFAPSARAEVAVANFKGLALMAGADNPKRAEYQKQWTQFCTQRKLSCSAGESATTLAAALMVRAPVDVKLADIRALAATFPEDMYVDLMASMAAVDPSAMSKLEVPLTDLKIEGESATGKAPQSNGRVSPLPFVKTESGWMLAFR